MRTGYMGSSVSRVRSCVPGHIRRLRTGPVWLILTCALGRLPSPPKVKAGSDTEEPQAGSEAADATAPYLAGHGQNARKRTCRSDPRLLANRDGPKHGRLLRGRRR